MEDSVSDIFAFALVTAGMILAITEFVLRKRWNRRYYRTGPTIFNREVHFPSGQPPASCLTLLQEKLGQGRFHRVLFHELNSGEIAFRVSFRLFFIPLFHMEQIMRGLIRRDPHTGTVRVEGRLNWFSLWFFAFVVVGFIRLIVLDHVSAVGALPSIAVYAAIEYSLFRWEADRMDKAADIIQGYSSGPIHRNGTKYP